MQESRQIFILFNGQRISLDVMPEDTNLRINCPNSKIGLGSGDKLFSYLSIPPNNPLVTG